MRFTITALLAAAAALVAGPAMATVFSYTANNPGGADGQGDISIFSTTYDDVAETLSLSVEVDGLTGNQAWLALSPGPNPKGVTGELALLYIDLDGNDVYAYAYSGQNNGQSWTNPGDFIGSYSNVVTQSVNGSLTTFGFSGIDVSGIQSHNPSPDADPLDWTGVAFGDQIGIWFHIVNGSLTQGAMVPGKGYEIDSFSYSGRQSWYDGQSKDATRVSEPAGAALIGFGLLGLVALRRRKRS